MQQTVLERIRILIEYTKVSDRKFGEIIGVPQTTISSLFKRGNEPNVTILNAILNAYKDISPEWLLTGKGEMLKSGYTQTDGVISVANEAQGEYQVQRKSIPLVTDLSATFAQNGIFGFGSYENNGAFVCSGIFEIYKSLERRKC